MIPMSPPNMFPHTTSQPRFLSITAWRSILTLLGVSSLNRSVTRRSTDSRILPTMLPSWTVSLSSLLRLGEIELTNILMKGIIFLWSIPIMVIMRATIPPSLRIFSSLDSSKVSNSSVEIIFCSWSCTLSGDMFGSSFPASCFSKNVSSKKVSMIIFFIVSLMDLNCRGMIPVPGIGLLSVGSGSNNIFTAIQFVTPPANPKRPAARMYRPATAPATLLSFQSSLYTILSASPTIIIAAVVQLLIFPFSQKPIGSPAYFIHCASRESSSMEAFPSGIFCTSSRSISLNYARGLCSTYQSCNLIFSLPRQPAALSQLLRVHLL
mmetsp:Transcript_9586/g.11128  ORF Transcript_9586/g.11128 Transcript_9586/m.11128 type:complete len:322 (-) Transcript_9586:209-1174(-)